MINILSASIPEDLSYPHRWYLVNMARLKNVSQSVHHVNVADRRRNPFFIYIFGQLEAKIGFLANHMIIF
jgi:hypothetical protein